MQKRIKKITASRNMILKDEFEVSRQSIHLALIGKTKSEMAAKIRARNKELLEEEIKRLKEIDSACAES